MPKKRAVFRASALLFCVVFALGAAKTAVARPRTDDFQYIVENEFYWIETENGGMIPVPVSGSGSSPSASGPQAPNNTPQVAGQAPTPQPNPEPSPDTRGARSDFTVDISPDSRTIVEKILVARSSSIFDPDYEERWSYNGESVNRTASYTVTVTSVNGFAGTVSLSLSGLPSGASASLPLSVDVPRNGQAIASLTVTSSGSILNNGTRQRSYTLTVSGYGTALAGLLTLPRSHPEYGASGVTRSDNAELVVKVRTHDKIIILDQPQFYPHDRTGGAVVQGRTADDRVVTGYGFSYGDVGTPNFYDASTAAAGQDARNKGAVTVYSPAMSNLPSIPTTNPPPSTTQTFGSSPPANASRTSSSGSSTSLPSSAPVNNRPPSNNPPSTSSTTRNSSSSATSRAANQAVATGLAILQRFGITPLGLPRFR